MIDDEQVMIYILNEILDAEQMADIFKMMMEYEDYPHDWLLDQFTILLGAVVEYSMSDRLGEFTDKVESMNFRKVDANSGEVASCMKKTRTNTKNSIDSFNPWER